MRLYENGINEMYDLGKGERRGAPVAPVCSFTPSLLDFVFNRGDGVFRREGALILWSMQCRAAISRLWTSSCSLLERKRRANSVAVAILAQGFSRHRMRVR